jgi:hypothetical protein
MKQKYTLVRMVMLLALLVAGLTVAAVPGVASTGLSSATLYVHATFSECNGVPVNVHRITAEWDELGVTWNSFAGAYDGNVAGSFLSNFGWRSADVTDLVGAWMAGMYPNYGLLLEQNDCVNAYDTKEGPDLANAPYLEVCYVDGACEIYLAAADTYVRQSQPNINFGAATYMASGWVNSLEKQPLIRFELPDIPCGEGCTPGYWKNHLEAWPATGFTTGADFDATFGVDYFDPDITLLQAVNLGGGGYNALARHGTAALLSAAHPDVDYPYTVAEVIALVQAGDKDALEAANELGCPLD